MVFADSLRIPPDLVENVARGSCVLFLGADYPLGGSGTPTRAQLAAVLIDRYGLTPGQSLADAAGQFLIPQPRNRSGLIDFLKDQVERTRALPPTEIHQAIVDLGFDAVVTTWYDNLLERAYEAAGKSVAKVVRGLDTAYSHGRDVIVVKLYGDSKEPNSLVITRRDMMRVEGHLAQRLEDVRPYVRLRPIMFVGWDPGDEALARLYTAATESLGEHKRRNYIVWPNPTPKDIAWWQEDNVEIIDAEPLPFLRALQRLAQQKRALLPGYRPGEVVGKLPYKFLDYFDPEDRNIFCGREVEAPLVYRMALSYPLLTLFGQSGVGKTSLLRAGVVPLLLEEGYNFAYVRALGEPLQAVRQGVCRALDLADCPGDTLLDFFRNALGKEDRLVVILDQFEELFIRANISKGTRRQFWRELGDCLGLSNPEVRFVLSLREDYLASLDEARRPLGDGEGEGAPIPMILRNSYRLTSLEKDTAFLAIVEPARRAQCTVDPHLAEVLLGRMPLPPAETGPRSSREEPLAVGTEANAPATDGATADGSMAVDSSTWSLAQADGTVPPPSLQIVMDRLYRDALEKAGGRPPAEGAAGKDWIPPELELTLEQYRALGGAGAILGDYVTDALDKVPQRGGDRGMAETLLKVMVTSQKTKAALDDAEMVKGMAETDPMFDPDDQKEKDCLHVTRAALVDLRLVRSFKVGDAAFYELAHDHMAAEVATWIGQEEMESKLARELLRRELENWRSLGKLIEPAALQLIYAQREHLRRLNQEELELLFRSALAVGEGVTYWADRAKTGGVVVGAILQEGLESERPNTRADAVALLGELGLELAPEEVVPWLAEALKDDYPHVRAQARVALERIGPEQARQILRDNPPQGMIYIPAGSFIMGDDQGSSDGKPAHEVTLQAFYIAKYPVTNAEYARFIECVGRRPPQHWTEGQVPPGKELHPVVNVSWYDAQEYAAWAGLRLLTEAEWEKAASWEEGDKAGLFDQAPKSLKRKYPWGDKFNKERCNTSESGIGDTTPVGQYSPAGDSPYGCADMAGNVREWTSSLYQSYPYRADDGREDVGALGSRVLRGGSFLNSRHFVCSAFRNDFQPGYINYRRGFRCGLLPRSLKH